MKRFIRFLLFTVIGFGPALFLWGIFTYASFQYIGLLQAEKKLAMIAFLAGEFLYPWIVLAIVFYQYMHVSGRGKRILVLYISWLFICVPIVLLFMMVLGGTSMAVVEGLITRGELYRQAGVASLTVFLFAHVFILPWVVGSHWLLNRSVFKADG